MRHVLLSNDDGVFAPGLRALAEAFCAAGWRVTVSAPDRERSGASHSISFRPLIVSPVRWEGMPEGAPVIVWKVDGTPADCVKLALHELCETKPDLVVSGINNGWNVGTDAHYSGTVGAAMEAAFEGCPAIAVSVRHPDAAKYTAAAAMSVRMAERLLAWPLPIPSVLNLNMPDCPPEEIHGVLEAPMSLLRYTDTYDRMDRPKGHRAFWIRGDLAEESCQRGGDLDCLMRGYATVTAIGWDLSIRGACENLLRDEYSQPT